MSRVAIEDLEEEKALSGEEMKMLQGGRALGNRGRPQQFPSETYSGQQFPSETYNRADDGGRAWPKNYTPK